LLYQPCCQKSPSLGTDNICFTLQLLVRHFGMICYLQIRLVA
jgi:hypothetical protein